MPMFELQKCDPGWGYDCRAGLFIPINDVGNLETIPGEKNFYFYYQQNPFRPDCFFGYEDIAHWVINENPNISKFMDFYFANYQNCEFVFKVRCCTKYIEAKKSDNYPEEATHFVDCVYYGMRMLIFVDKENSRLFDENERDKFLEKIWKGEEKLTKEQENAECSVLIFAKNPEETTAKQMKMGEVLQFFEDFKNEKHPQYEIEVYCEISALPAKMSVFDETFEERMKLFGEKCFGEANQMDSQTIIMDKNSLYSMKPKILKSLKMPIILSNDVEKPYVWNKDFNDKMLLGFVSHVNQPTAEVIGTNELLMMRCPKKCSNDDRQWICTTCGLFLRVSGFDVVCDCGVANISDLTFECFEPTHLKTFTIWQTHFFPANFTDEQNTMLKAIRQQLEKIVKKEGMSADEKLSSVIQSIDNDDGSIFDQLEALDLTNLDGNTANLINNFVNSLK